MDNNSRVACARGLVWHALDLLDLADERLTVPLAEVLAAAVKRIANARQAMHDGSNGEFEQARTVVETVLAGLVRAANLPGDRRDFCLDTNSREIYDYIGGRP